MMSKRKIVLISILILSVLGIIGSPILSGFLGSPMAHISIPAEPLLKHSLFGIWNLTNSILVTWIVIILLTIVSFYGTRNLKETPGRFQCLLESIIEYFVGLAEDIGGKNGRKFLPFILTIFIFIVASNWIGILPGFGTIGILEPAKDYIHHKEEIAEKAHEKLDLKSVKMHIYEGNGPIAILPLGSVNNVIDAHTYEHDGVPKNKRAGVLIPFLRSANTDINTTLAIAIVAMIMIHWWGLRQLGTMKHLSKFFTFKGGVVGFFVGLIEAISEVARVISFTFRLFGNIFAGEVLLMTMAFLIPLVGIIPFLGLELFVGLIQAFIFAILTLVFASTATSDEH